MLNPVIIEEYVGCCPSPGCICAAASGSLPLSMSVSDRLSLPSSFLLCCGGSQTCLSRARFERFLSRGYLLTVPGHYSSQHCIRSYTASDAWLAYRLRFGLHHCQPNTTYLIWQFALSVRNVNGPRTAGACVHRHQLHQCWPATKVQLGAFLLSVWQLRSRDLSAVMIKSTWSA